MHRRSFLAGLVGIVRRGESLFLEEWTPPRWPRNGRPQGIERFRRCMRPLAVLVAALVILGPVGCAHRAPPPTAMLEPKSDVGAVGLVLRLHPPSPTFQRPGAVGAADGARVGGQIGWEASLRPGLFFLTGSLDAFNATGFGLGLVLTGAGLVLAPFGLLVGAAAGALAAPSNAKVEESMAALERAFADINPPDALAAWIIEAGGQRGTPPVADPAAPAVDTVLKLDNLQVSLTSKDPTDWRPGLELRVAISAKLSRASDGEEVRAWSWEHEGRKANFFEWGKDDARLFRAELEQAGRALAAKLIGDMFEKSAPQSSHETQSARESVAAQADGSRLATAAPGVGEAFSPMKMKKKAIEDCGHGDALACISAPIALPFTTLVAVVAAPLVFPILVAAAPSCPPPARATSDDSSRQPSDPEGTREDLVRP